MGVVRFGHVLLQYLHRTVCRELTVHALLLVELRVQEFRVPQVQEFRVLQVQDFRVRHFSSSGDVLEEEVGPLVGVETGLNRQASSGRWKFCLSSCRAAR